MDSQAQTLPVPTRPGAAVPRAAGYLPLLGHLPKLSWDLPGLMRSLDSSRGRLQRVRLPGQWDIHVWAHPDAFTLFKNKVTSSSHLVSLSAIITGHRSMLTVDGDDHRHQRRASSQPFTPRGLSMSGVSAMCAEVVTARVEGLLGRASVMLLEETQSMALEIIFRVLGVPRGELPAWVQRYNILLKGVMGARLDLPGLPYHRALKARAWVDERLGVYVDEARRSPDATGLIAGLVQGRDDEGRALEDAEVFDNVRLMILAGHETTASVIAWMASYAATRPEVHARLMEEALASDGLPMTPKELRRLPYTEAVFREALRLHPPATLATRLALEPIEVEGHVLPEGTVLGIPIWLLCRDPSIYPSPERFMPERWMDRDRPLSPLEQGAFGGGPHYCLGAHMALLESVQFMVALMRGLSRAGRRLHMTRIPRARYTPLLRPKMADTRCALRPAADVDSPSAP